MEETKKQMTKIRYEIIYLWLKIGIDILYLIGIGGIIYLLATHEIIIKVNTLTP